MRGALAGALLWLAAAPAWGGGPLPVVTTTTDLKALVEAVGGDRVRAISLAPALHDPHSVEVKPGALAELREPLVITAHLAPEDPRYVDLRRNVLSGGAGRGSAADCADHGDPEVLTLKKNT